MHTATENRMPIKPRKMNFKFEQISSALFFNDNLLLSAWVAALSASFPPGEGEFIASVRNYRDRVTEPQMKADIRGFIGQEGHHSHQHKMFNEQLTQLGFDASKLEIYFVNAIKKQYQKWPLKRRLAVTAGMEHLTAIMSDFILNNQDLFNNVDPGFRDLFSWHAVEEIEHKAVAYDVYMAFEGDQAYLRRMLIIATLVFVRNNTVGFIKLLWWRKQMPKWKDLIGFLSFLLGKKGMLRWIVGPFMDYLKKGFHPWQHDNMKLVDYWKNELNRQPQPS